MDGREFLAPLYQQLVDWFREKHNFNIEITYKNSTHKYTAIIYPIEGGVMTICGVDYSSYYEALNAALTEAFKLI